MVTQNDTSWLTSKVGTVDNLNENFLYLVDKNLICFCLKSGEVQLNSMFEEWQIQPKKQTKHIYAKTEEVIKKWSSKIKNLKSFFILGRFFEWSGTDFQSFHSLGNFGPWPVAPKLSKKREIPIEILCQCAVQMISKQVVLWKVINQRCTIFLVQKRRWKDMEFLKVEHLDGGTFASGPCLGIFDDLREGGKVAFPTSKWCCHCSKCHWFSKVFLESQKAREFFHLILSNNWLKSSIYSPPLSKSFLEKKSDRCRGHKISRSCWKSMTSTFSSVSTTPGTSHPALWRC